MAEDEELKQLESELDEQLAKLGATDSSYGSPKAPTKDNMLLLFRDLIKSQDSRKVSNLGKIELHNVRSYLNIALYADAEGLDLVSLYLQNKAENTLSTAMSKKGFFAQLIVTNIKKEQKLRTPELKKKGWFGKKTEEVEAE